MRRGPALPARVGLRGRRAKSHGFISAQPACRDVERADIATRKLSRVYCRLVEFRSTNVEKRSEM
jgi:hypothetical protein